MATTTSVDQRHGLRELAENAGKGASALASELGVSRAAVGHWFRGRSRPQPEHFPPLAKALGVTVDDIRAALAEVQRRKDAGRPDS